MASSLDLLTRNLVGGVACECGSEIELTNLENDVAHGMCMPRPS